MRGFPICKVGIIAELLKTSRSSSLPALRFWSLSAVSAWRNVSDEQEPVVAYNASKGAVVSLTRDMAVKLAADNIRVNGIAPGSFLTDMMNHLRFDERALEAFESRIPQQRSGGEDDIKGVVVFLAGPASAFMTGQTLVVDGGWLCT